VVTPHGSSRSPTIRLLAGLAITLTAVAVLLRLHHHPTPQPAGTPSPHHRSQPHDSLLLLRIQNNLNSVASLCATCLMARALPADRLAWPVPTHPYRSGGRPRQEERTSPLDRGADQRRYLSDSSPSSGTLPTVSSPSLPAAKNRRLALSSTSRYRLGRKAQHRRRAAPDSRTTETEQAAAAPHPRNSTHALNETSISFWQRCSC